MKTIKNVAVMLMLALIISSCKKSGGSSSSTWSELGGSNDSTFNGPINSIATDKAGNIYAGGWFTNANGKYYVAKWNGSSWSELGGINTSTFNSFIRKITTDAAGNIYAAAMYFNGNNYVAKWNGSSWSTLGGTNFSFDGGISTIAQTKQAMYMQHVPFFIMRMRKIM